MVDTFVHRRYPRPVFYVSDIQCAIQFYVDLLGFEKSWHTDDGAGMVCQVNRSDCEIILCEDDSRNDKTRLFVELTANGIAELRCGMEERSIPTRLLGGDTTPSRSTIPMATNCTFQFLIND